MSSILTSFSPLWALTNAVARRWMKSRSYRLPVPVISVGNIVAGGVGKTELVTKIAQHYLEKGLKVVVATRGYGSEWSKKGGFARNFETGASFRFPDEALVILKKANGCSVVVGANRVATLKRYWQEIEPDIVILDDGFQHFKLYRDLDILVHDFNIRWPILRDLPSQFEKVGLRVSFSNVPTLWQKLDWVRVQYVLTSKLPKEGLVFCGIGNPIRLKKFLENNGIKIRGMKKFKDHKNYTQEDVKMLLRWQKQKSSNERLPLITTQKDYVKLVQFLESQGGIGGFDVHTVDIDIEFIGNKELFWRTIDEHIRVSST